MNECNKSSYLHVFFLTIGMYLVTFDLIKKKIGAGANFGEEGPEKQLFFYHGLIHV